MAQEELPEICSLCLDPLDIPRVLPCGHSLCGSPNRCLQRLLQGPRPKCPLDRNDICANGATSISDFPLNRSLISAMKRCNMHNPTLSTPDNNESSSSVADSGASVSAAPRFSDMCESHYMEKDYYCRDCKVTMCKTCWEVHTVKGHTIVLFEIYKKELQSQLGQSISMFKPVQRKITHVYQKHEGAVSDYLKAGEQLNKVLKLYEKRKEIINDFLSARTPIEVEARKSSFLMLNLMIKQELHQYAEDGQEIVNELTEILSEVNKDLSS